MATFGQPDTSTDMEQQQKKKQEGVQTQPSTSPMVTAIHGPADAIHPMVAALHGGGAQTPQQPKVNTFGAAPQTQSTGGGEVNGSVGQSLMRAQQPAQANFHGVLSDASQGGRINSLLSNQAGDAANIRAEKASNAPMEREHMAHMWADEDVQRHQEQQMRQLELERGKYQFHEAQKFPGSPMGPHWAALKEKVISDPMSYQMGKDASGKMVRGGLLPQHQQFIDYIDQQMRGLTEEGHQQPQQPLPVAQGKVDETKALETPGMAANVGNAIRAGVETAGPIAAGVQAAKRIGPKLAGLVPNRFGGQIIRKLVPGATFLGGASVAGGVENELDPGGIENMRKHPWASTIGALLSGGIGVGSKTPPTPKGDAGLAPGPTVTKPIGKSAAQQAPKGVQGQIFPKPSKAKESGGVGATFNSATEEAQKPLQGSAPQNANGPATAGTVQGGVPTMITREMERTLKALGFSDAQISTMKPADAWSYVLKGIPKGSFGK